VIVEQGPRHRVEDVARITANRLLVCDGIGGGADGHLAAKAAADLAETVPFSRITQEVHAAVYAAVGPAGGTTCTVAALEDGQVRWLHCGDSALWLALRVAKEVPPQIRRLTAEHTLWAALRRAHPEEKIKHGKNVLLSSVSGPGLTQDETTWDTGAVPIPSHVYAAWLLGTSDGFHEAFHDESGVVDLLAMTQALRDHASAARMRKLVEQCAEKTRDNASLAFWRIK
jgi:serine/threonine protein phosphatase PrpC